MVAHPDGLATLYAHLDQIDVTSGVAIEQGERPGSMGTTGAVTGVNLPYEVLVKPGFPRTRCRWRDLFHAQGQS